MSSIDIPYLRSKRRVSVQLAEDITIDTPQRVYAVVPKTDNLTDSFIEITYQQAIRTIDALGRWLKSALGFKLNCDFEKLTYCGASDLQYTLLREQLKDRPAIMVMSFVNYLADQGATCDERSRYSQLLRKVQVSQPPGLSVMRLCSSGSLSSEPHIDMAASIGATR